MNRIKKLRVGNKLTIKYVSESINVSLKDYIKYEKDFKNMPVDTLYKLADFYNVSTDYLLYRTDILKPYDNKKH